MPRPRKLTIANQTPESEALDLLRRLLEHNRVKTITKAYVRGKCLGCNHPHVNGVCRSDCPCHEAVEYLREHGIEIDL